MATEPTTASTDKQLLRASDNGGWKRLEQRPSEARAGQWMRPLTPACLSQNPQVMTITPPATDTDMNTMRLVLRGFYSCHSQFAGVGHRLFSPTAGRVLMKANLGRVLTAVSSKIVNVLYS